MQTLEGVGAVAAESRGADELDRFEGAAGDDEEADAVALLDRLDGRLAGVPGEADDEGVAGADDRDAGEEEAEAAGDDRGEGDRPEALDRDPGGRLGGEGGGGFRPGERRPDVIAGALRPPQPEAEDQRDRPPGEGDDGGRRARF